MTWYNTGTVKTTANSAVVMGTGTAWTNSGLRPGDMLLIGYNTVSPRSFEIKSIDNDTQITLVIAFPVAVTEAAYVGIPMLSGDRTAITMTLAQQITKAFADNQTMQAVWQTFYTSPGTVSLTMPGGLLVSGSSFAKLTADMVDKLDKSQNLSDIPDKAAARISLDLKGAAVLDVGKKAGTVAAGDDSRIDGALQRSTGGTLNGNLTCAGNSLATFNGGVLISLASGLTMPGRVAGTEGNNNNISLVSGDGSTASSDFAGAHRYNWYGDFWIAGITRGPGRDSLSYSIYYNGAATGAYKVWAFNRDGSASGAGPWVNGSDKRHKSKIQAVESPLSAVCSWLGCSYDLQDGERSVGLIAQDVEVWCPEAVKTYGPREFSDKSVVEDFKYMDTSGVAAAYHTEAIKQLFKLVELALEDPDACRAQINEIKAAMLDGTQSEQAS